MMESYSPEQEEDISPFACNALSKALNSTALPDHLYTAGQF
jgi:hypothetical protein